MARTWVAHGDSSGRHYVNPMFVESLVCESMSPTGIYSVRIKTISGQAYYAYFPTAEEQEAFVSEWAGETLTLDLEMED